MSWRYAVVALPLVGYALGCGGDGPTPGDLATADTAQQLDLAGVDLPTVPDLALPATYPAGPYGNTVGAIIPPLAWEGYADPAADALASTKPYGAYTMNDLRLSGMLYGIVHVSSFG